MWTRMVEPFPPRVKIVKNTASTSRTALGGGTQKQLPERALLVDPLILHFLSELSHQRMRMYVCMYVRMYVCMYTHVEQVQQ